MGIKNMECQGSIAPVSLVMVGNYSAILYKLSCCHHTHTRTHIYMLVTGVMADTEIKRFMFENV